MPGLESPLLINRASGIATHTFGRGRAEWLPHHLSVTPCFRPSVPGIRESIWMRREVPPTLLASVYQWGLVSWASRLDLPRLVAARKDTWIA